MSCNCYKPHMFKIQINGETRDFAGLDVVVFMTTACRPKTVEETKNLLWERATIYNDIDSKEEHLYKGALYEAYLKMPDRFP